MSHSFGAALAASLLAAAFVARRGSGFRVSFVVSFLSYASHLLLDMLGPDGRLPYGIPLLWPLSAQPFLFPHPFLMGIRHAKAAGDSISLWISGIVHPANLLAVLLEVLLLVPVLVGGLLFQRIRRHRHGTGAE